MKFIVLNGYSAGGKSMILDGLIKGDFNVTPIEGLQQLVTCTTRKPRTEPIKEINGVHYNFLNLEEFEKLKLVPNFDKISFEETVRYCEQHNIKEAIIEETEYAGIKYGILYSEVKKIYSKGFGIGVFDLHGIEEMKRIFGKENVISIFIYRDLQDVRKSLLERNTSEYEVNKRLKQAEKEIKNISKTDYVVFNTCKTKKQVCNEVKEIINNFI